MAAKMVINIEVKVSLLFKIIHKVAFLVKLFIDKEAFSLYINDELNDTFTFRELINY